MRVGQYMNTNVRKVALFCEKWGSGGIEIFVLNLLSQLGENYRIDLIVAQLDDRLHLEKLSELGVRLVYLGGSVSTLTANHERFKELLMQECYDVVHVHAYQGLSMEYLADAKVAGVPVRIIHSHNSALRKSITRPLKMAIHRYAKGKFAPAATHYWACSDVAAKFMFSKRTSWDFIPNGIDLDEFQLDETAGTAIKEKLGWQENKIVGTVGRLCHQKNQAFLIEAFAEVVKKMPEARLLVVGAGELEENLKEKVNQLGLDKLVCFYGTTTNVCAVLSAMDVFALPSLFEGLPLTLLEAQAMGIPCVVSDGISPDGILLDTTVALPLSDVTLWCSKLSSMVGVGYSSDVVRRNMERFDIKRVARGIDSAYQGGKYQ